MSTPLLTFDHVTMNYHDRAGETTVLREFSLSIEKGEFVAILGPSGCGKSTILSLAAGLIFPDSGQVLLRGESIRRPATHMGYMLQRDQLFPWLTVRDNATLGLRVRGKPTQQQLDYVDNLLDSCGLTDFACAFPGQLSGGMRQRVALVRTLAVEPDFLLLDEPFSALDAQTRIQLSDEVKGILQKAACATLLVTHDVSEAISLADRILVLSHRPATIKSVYDIDLPGTPMQRRRDSRFKDYFNMIWKELDVHVE